MAQALRFLFPTVRVLKAGGDLLAVMSKVSHIISEALGIAGTSMNVIAEYAFEIAAVFIAALALIAAERAIRISKQALELTKSSSLVALRIRAQEALSDAERSFLVLQGDCRQVCEQWENHHRKQRPMMSFGAFERPKEIQGVYVLERSGNALLREIVEKVPAQDAGDEANLERFIGFAKAKAVEIERLRLQLEAPRPFPH